MKTVTEVENVLQGFSSDEIVSILCHLFEQRPDVSAAFFSKLQPSKPSSSTQDGVAEHARTPLTGVPRPDASAATLSEGPASFFVHQRPVAHIPECWAIIFLFLFNGVMLVTVAISYTMSIGSGRVKRSDFYISSSIDTGWPHRIGDLGISIAFIAYLFSMLMRFVAVKKSLMDPLSSSVALGILWLNRLALIASLFAALGALGVGAFNVSFNYAVHITFAFDTFASAAVSITLHSCIDELICCYSVPGHPIPGLHWRICRFLLCISYVTGLIGMFSSGSGGDIEASCIYELIMASSLCAYYATWASGKGYTVGVKVILEEKSLRTLRSFSSGSTPAIC